MSINSDEARQILQRATKTGNAAVVIVAIGEEKLFLWQRKTHGYPVSCMVGSLCLFGGNKEEEDASAADTLTRELREEIPSSLAEEIIRNMKPFSRYIVEASPVLMAPKLASYAFVACVYESSISSTVVDGNILEGKAEFLSLDSLLENKFTWGYDFVFHDYQKEILHQVRDMQFRTDYDRCIVSRVSPQAKVGEWADDGYWI